MLKIKISKYGFPTFLCKNCGVEDSSYARMPQECYYCNTPYDFHVEELLENLIDRIKYHLPESRTKLEPFKKD